MHAAASIWLEIWGSWIRVNKISIFPGKCLKNFNFSRQIFAKISIFSGKFVTNFSFSRQICEKFRFFTQFKKNRFSRQKLLIYSDFWANYSISLQKSPLSNIIPVHDKI